MNSEVIEQRAALPRFIRVKRAFALIIDRGALALAILVHVMLLWIGLRIAHAHWLQAPTITWAEGNSGAGQGLVQDNASQADEGPILRSLPAPAAIDSPIQVNDVDPSDDEARHWSPARVSLNLPDLADSNAIFGMGSDASGSKPTIPGKARPGKAAGGNGSGNASAVSASSATHVGTGTGRTTSGGRPGIAGGVADARAPAPIYPEESRRRHEQGTIVLAIEVQADGHVGNISVVQGQDHPLLVKAAVDAVRKKEVFPPLLQNGQPVTSVAQLAFHFELH